MEIARVNPEACWSVIKTILQNTITNDGHVDTPIPGLSFFRSSQTNTGHPCLYEPMLIIVVNGSKEIMIGSEVVSCTAHTFFLSNVDLPATSCVTKASDDNPFLAISLKLNLQTLTALIPEMAEQPSGGVCLAPRSLPLENELLDAVTRLLQATESPDTALISLLLQEIYIRLLKTPFGSTLWALTVLGSQENNVNQAITWLKANYTSRITIEELASMAHMGLSTFHKYFKAMTGVSPLQFQKRLRLNKANQLLSNGLDVTSTSLKVGYASVTQFCREYKKLYGSSPRHSKTHKP